MEFMALGKTILRSKGWLGLGLGVLFLMPWFVHGKSELDRRLKKDNEERKDLAPGPFLDDLQYLRKVSVDLIGRIPGEKEIKRIFHNYKNKWCKAGLMINNHQEFRSESEVIFRLVQDRIQAESEQLYPLARKLSKVAA